MPIYRYIVFLVLLSLVFSSYKAHAVYAVDTSYAASGILELTLGDVHEAIAMESGRGDTVFLLANVGTFDNLFEMDVVLLKLTANGELIDTIRFDLPGMDYSIGTALELLPDGRLMISAQGYAFANNSYQPGMLCMLKANGKMDSTFGANGFLLSPFYGNYDLVRGIELDEQGRLLAYGSAIDTLEGFRDAAVIGRLDQYGQPDTTFGGTGMIEIDLLDSISTLKGSRHLAGGIIYDVLELGNGQLLLSGGYSNFISFECFFMLLNADASIDSSFGINGVSRLDISFYDNDQAIELLQLDNGDILFAANSTEIEGDFYVGTVDRYTGATTIVPVDISNQHDKLFDALITDDGDLLLCGEAGEEMAMVSMSQAIENSSYEIALNEPNRSLLGTYNVMAQLTNGTILAFGRSSTSAGQNNSLMVVAYKKGEGVGTSVELENNANGLQLYPNPVKGELTIETDVNSSIIIVDNIGLLVLSAKVSAGVNRVNLSALPAGLYIASIESDKGMVIQHRLIIHP